MATNNSEEQKRLSAQYTENKKWLLWGPYLSERQWGTVREDYSADGDAWNYTRHDMARSKAFRWGEDGIGGISDDKQHLCFAPAFWNGKDPILKERLFGLSNPQGNHGEDVKELYYYLDNTPTHSYMKYLYKYPQQEFPYNGLEQVNQSRSRKEPEYEIVDTGIFSDGKYFDIFIEYAKAAEEDICIRISIHNRQANPASIALLPTIWFRNRWSFGLSKEKPEILRVNDGTLKITDEKLGTYLFHFPPTDHVLFTENETNTQRLYQLQNENTFVKDAFHEAVIKNKFEQFGDRKSGTKCAPVYSVTVEGKHSAVFQFRLCKDEISDPLGDAFGEIFSNRIQEADSFYARLISTSNKDLSNIQRQAYSGMLWNKQFYYFDIPSWLNGDPGQVPPPSERKSGRDSKWKTLNNEDIISMPDKWEYPWYSAWDLPFHCVVLAAIDPDFAKGQLVLLLREWYMNPYGQVPAYEWDFGDANPPVQAWACMRVYEMDKKKKGTGDTLFLERVFQKLLINFTWWVNRKDTADNNIFEGGFLGMDNIGVFDRDAVPDGGILEQADGSAWMGMYCLDMMEIALELAQTNRAYEDLATKFFEHFTYIAQSMNQMSSDMGSWDEEDGFFYDVFKLKDGTLIPLKVRSLVGLTSLFAVHVIDKSFLKKVPEFYKRLKWFVTYQRKNNKFLAIETNDEGSILLSLAPRGRLKKIIESLLDEKEFLSPGGIRSLSKVYEQPYHIQIGDHVFSLNYEPGNSESALFGGNSNWRGPVWMPMNYEMIKSLEEYYQYFGEKFLVELPTNSGNKVSFKKVAEELKRRLISNFEWKEGGRKIYGDVPLFNSDPHFKDLILFFEFFHGDTSKGLGASHQTGWTGLVADLIMSENFQKDH